MQKTLEQLEYYKAHYQQIYFKAKLRVKPTLLKHLRKLSAENLANSRRLINYSLILGIMALGKLFVSS